MLLVPCVRPDEVTDLFKLYMEVSCQEFDSCFYCLNLQLSKLHFKHT